MITSQTEIWSLMTEVWARVVSTQWTEVHVRIMWHAALSFDVSFKATPGLQKLITTPLGMLLQWVNSQVFEAVFFLGTQRLKYFCLALVMSEWAPGQQWELEKRVTELQKRGWGESGKLTLKTTTERLKVGWGHWVFVNIRQLCGVMLRKGYFMALWIQTIRTFVFFSYCNFKPWSKKQIW